MNFVDCDEDENKSQNPAGTEQGPIDDSQNLSPTEADGKPLEGVGPTVQGPPSVEPSQSYGIKTWAVVDRVCLDNTRPSDLVEGGRIRKYYFSPKTRLIILKNIFSYINVKKQFLTIKGKRKDFPTIALVDENNLEE